jgi:hypothetical protein
MVLVTNANRFTQNWVLVIPLFVQLTITCLNHETTLSV